MSENKTYAPRVAPPKKFPFIQTINSWAEIIRYVKTISDVRKKLCEPCGTGYLYDCKNEMYRISRFDTLAKVTSLIEKIRKINTETSE